MKYTTHRTQTEIDYDIETVSNSVRATKEEICNMLNWINSN
jgi:hypothetical protein